ncbi:MAG: ATP-binding protein [Gammaproteobacteria bacterium]|nr:ATP-binding protein [Gammaproteobacteria bacterium]
MIKAMPDTINSINNEKNKHALWSVPLLLSLFLIMSSFYSFLLFHTLAEYFAITIGILMCVVAWQTYPFTRNNFLMYLGCGYFWIAILDMMHTLTYKDMNIFANSGANTAVQLWIGTRYLEALLLLSAPIFLSTNLNRLGAFITFGIAASVIFLSVMTGNFPQGFIEGKGLTQFKVLSEYVIILLLCGAGYYLYRQRKLLDQKILNLVYISVGFTICAELAFTFYIDVFSLSNLLGHIFKFFSFWLIFVSIVRTTLREPFTVMARNASNFNAIPLATIVVDDKNIVRQANRSAAMLIGRDHSTIVGSNAHYFFHPQRYSEHQCEICRSTKEGFVMNWREFELDDDDTWWAYSLSPVSSQTNTLGMIQVIRDITDRKHAEKELIDYRINLEELVEARTRELEIARDQALSATKTKSAFLANMSHELRTPLNSIIGFTGIIKGGMAGPVNEVQTKQLEMVYSSANHLLRIINDILDLSKVEAGKMEVEKEFFLASDLVEELRNQNAVLFEKKSIDFHVKGTPPSVEIYSDRSKLYQILLNLISNALKFTKKGSVTLSYSVKHDDLEISVEDTGIGIPVDEQLRIFDTFHQTREDKIAGGTGLGLAISKKFCEMLGGNIKLRSEPGKGSIFTITLYNCINREYQYEKEVDN